MAISVQSQVDVGQVVIVFCDVFISI